MKHREVRLYEVWFPTWFLMLLPPAWGKIGIYIFLRNSLVLCIAVLALKIQRPVRFYFRHILQVFVLGCAADFLAVLPMVAGVMLDLGGENGDSPLITIPGVLTAGLLIYAANRFLSFRDCEKEQRKKLAMIFALATAPYLFFLPGQ